MSEKSAQISPDQRRVLTISTLTRVLDMSRSSVVRLLDDGIIPSRDLGGRQVVLADDLDAALAKLPARPVKGKK